MNRNSTATLLLVSLMLCLLATSYLGGTATSNGQNLSDGNRQYDNGVTSSHSFYQLSPGSLDENVTLVNLWVNRTVGIGDYGSITVNDTVMIHNNDSRTASSWTFYLPQDLYPKLRYVAASANVTVSANETRVYPLDVIQSPLYSSYVGMQVEFGNIGGLAANSSVRVTITQQYIGIVRLVAGTQNLAIYFYKFIISPYVTVSHNTTVQIPDTGSTTAGNTTESRFYTGKNIIPFSSTVLGSSSDGGWRFTLPTPLLEILSIDRNMELYSTGYLSTTETYQIKNLGPTNLKTFQVRLPISALPGTLQARDSVGFLTSTVNGTNATVTFRGGLPLQVNWTYSFYISYTTSVDEYRTVEDGLDVIKMQSVTVSDCGVDSERVVFVLPPHTNVSSVDQFADQVQIQGDKPVVTYTFKNIASMNNQTIQLKYSVDLAQTLERPLLLSLGFFFIGLVYVCAGRIVPRGKPTGIVREEEKTRELRGLIKEFSSNYEEKTALTLESDKLAEDRRKGRVSKREYVERLNVSKRRIASLINVINEEKRKLALANKRYASMIRQLDTYEEERENARASLENLELRRRQGKATGDVYNRLKHENTKKIDRATAGIDSIIMQFRQETL